jgi:hypothetical protein
MAGYGLEPHFTLLVGLISYGKESKYYGAILARIG